MKNVIMKWNTGSLMLWLPRILAAIAASWRPWLFRGLVAVAAGLMVASFIMPWWDCVFNHWWEYIPPVKIYAYGLRHTWVQLREWIAADETPFYQTVLAWIYLAVTVGLMLYSTWLKGRKGKWLLGGIGLIYIAYAAIAVILIAIRTGDYSISLQGWGTIKSGGETVRVFSSLRFGYYLAYSAGGMCILLALLRDVITGKLKPGT